MENLTLVFERIQSASHRILDVVLPLYSEAFPPEERRTTSDLLRMLQQKEMFFSAILLEEQVVGLIVYWRFEGFNYLEHLAVLPSRRKQGIGEMVLKELQKEEAPILLEVEIPHDEDSTQRVTFYHRLGFRALPVYYHQPPYRKGEKVVPMMLFSDKSDWDQELLQASTELFQNRVYYKNN
jgi:ribosomal protein S18 acetylase RimI-like enzyme